MKTLLIDDIRDLTADLIARSYEAGIFALKHHKWELLRLDHDLSSYVNGVEKTGYDVLCWLEQNPQHMPQQIELVTANPVGRLKMNALIRNWQERGVLK
jgi:hypothetical protein